MTSLPISSPSNPFAPLVDPEIAVQRAAFMRAAFAPLASDERTFWGYGLPTGQVDKNGKPIPRFDPLLDPSEPLSPFGLHYNSCTFVASAVRARAEYISRAFVAVLDDLGNMAGKSRCSLARILALPAAAKPHAIISTRSDPATGAVNCQAAFFIEPCPAGEVAELLRAITKNGWGDPGAIGRGRWCRPPGSLKFDGNGHMAQLVVSRLDAPRIAIDALAAAFGVPDFRARQGKASAGNVKPSTGINLPDAAMVRAAMARLRNDASMNRAEWIRIGMALRACCGKPPALSDEEGFALFDAWSRLHASYDTGNTERAWRSLSPTGEISFGTIAHVAETHGWHGVRAERALIEGEKNRAHLERMLRRLGVQNAIIPPWRAR